MLVEPSDLVLEIRSVGGEGPESMLSGLLAEAVVVALRRAMSANAKHWAREEFNWQVQSKPLYEAYSALTNNRRHVVTQKAS